MTAVQVREDDRMQRVAAGRPSVGQVRFDGHLHHPEVMGAIIRDLLRFEGERDGTGKRKTPEVADGMRTIQDLFGGHS